MSQKYNVYKLEKGFLIKIRFLPDTTNLTPRKMANIFKRRKDGNFKLKPFKKRPPKTKLGRRLKDPFGNVILLKRALTSLIGAATYGGLNIVNKLNVEGMEYLSDLPKANVLFVSNHQTYFADVFALYHIFCSVKWRMKNINLPLYLLSPRVKSYFIAAEETMKNDGLLPKLFSYTGALTVKRSWRSKGKDVKRGADFRAPAKIKKALEYGWVITFPQGTTTPNAPVRKGSASLIKAFNPLVVFVEIEGFRTAFDKKGLKIIKKGVQLSVKFEKPMQFGEEATVEEIHRVLEEHLLDE